MTPSTEPAPAYDPGDDEGFTPPAWWLAAARRKDDDRHAGPAEEQGVEPRAFDDDTDAAG